MYQLLFGTPEGWRSVTAMCVSDLMPTLLFARDWSLYVYSLDHDDPYAHPWRCIGVSARYYMEIESTRSHASN